MLQDLANAKGRPGFIGTICAADSGKASKRANDAFQSEQILLNKKRKNDSLQRPRHHHQNRPVPCNTCRAPERMIDIAFRYFLSNTALDRLLGLTPKPWRVEHCDIDAGHGE